MYKKPNGQEDIKINPVSVLILITNVLIQMINGLEHYVHLKQMVIAIIKKPLMRLYQNYLVVGAIPLEKQKRFMIGYVLRAEFAIFRVSHRLFILSFQDCVLAIFL